MKGRPAVGIEHSYRRGDLLLPVTVGQRFSELVVMPAALHELPTREKNEAFCADGSSGRRTEVVELSAKLTR